MMKFLATAALALAATGGQAATYTSSRTVGTATANISITTDDTIGTLTAGNILDWTILLGVGGETAALYGPDSGDTSRVLLAGTALSATATDLLFNFSASGQAYMLFQSTEGDRSLYCVQTVNCFDQTRGEEIVSVGPTFTNFQRIGQTGSVSIGSTQAASVPEPTTWAMLILGFGTVGAALRRRRLSSAAPSA